jgi:hypothetical protein
MTENAGLIESSFADAIAMIAAAKELPEHTRRHWPTSLRKIAQALDRPLEVIPARYSAVRNDLNQLHHVPAGFTAKTLQNHKSNVKSSGEGSSAVWLPIERGMGNAHGADRGQPASFTAIRLYPVLFSECHHIGSRRRNHS